METGYSRTLVGFVQSQLCEGRVLLYCGVGERRLEVSDRTKPKKTSLEEAARELTSIALQHLEPLSPDQREKRITSFERAISKACRGSRAASNGPNLAAFHSLPQSEIASMKS